MRGRWDLKAVLESKRVFAFGKKTSSGDGFIHPPPHSIKQKLHELRFLFYAREVGCNPNVVLGKHLSRPISQHDSPT